MGRFSRQISFLHRFFSSFFKRRLNYCSPSGDTSTPLSAHQMGAVNCALWQSREKGRVLEFETKGRKMSWLEKSAGIVMSEIILGNAGVCCKGPGKRQFITSLGSDTQPAHTHTDTAVQPARGQTLTPRWEGSLGMAGRLSDGRRGKRGSSGAGVTWIISCHQILELGSGFPAAPSLLVSGLTLWDAERGSSFVLLSAGLCPGASV